MGMRLATLAILGTLILTTAWLVWNSLPYFAPAMLRGEVLAPFLVEKGALSLESWWRAIFVAHVAGAIACLAVGPFLVWNLLLLRSRLAHIWIGRAYVVLVLSWGAPAGLVLSFTAKGGWGGQSAFFLLGALWWVTTFLGLREIRARRTVPHVRWMLRSYCLATSALSFRVFHVLFYFSGLPDRTNYIVSLWVSLAMSLICGELCAARAQRILARTGPRPARGAKRVPPPCQDLNLLEKGAPLVKWCLPAFGTSLVVFLLLFTAIDLRQSETKAESRSHGSMIEPRPGDTASGETVSTDAPRSALGARERGSTREPVPSATVPSASTIAPPEGEVATLENEPRALPAAVALVFEDRLEDEFLKPLRERRSSWFDRRQFSRAAPRVERLDFTRIEVPRDAAPIADAALVVRRYGARGVEELRLILLRVEGADAPFEIALASAESGASNGWGSSEKFVEGFPGTFASLPIAPKERKRRRAVGPTYERMRVEQIEKPLAERAEELELTSMLSRMFPSESSFTFRGVDNIRLWPADVDGLIELTATGVTQGSIVHMPVRYHVDSGEMQVQFADEWREATECIAKIRARRFLIPPEELDEAAQHFGVRLGVEWVLDS